MFKDFLIKEIKKILYKAISKHADIIEGDKHSTYLFIRAINENGYPGLKIMNKEKKVLKDIDFKDISLCAKFGIGAIVNFDIEKQLPAWIQKFIVMSCKDEDITDLTSPFYLIKVIGEKDCAAFMYKANKDFKEVNIDYILKTE